MLKEGVKNKYFNIMKTISLEAPLEYFDEFQDISDSGEEIEMESFESELDANLDIDDPDIEHADIEIHDELETGELGDNEDEDLPDEGIRKKPRQADIIFRLENNSINYKIYLGDLIFNRNKNIIEARRDAMTSLAEFLIINQKKYLLSPGIIVADENLRSLKQKELLEFHNQKYPKEKKDSGWSTKVIKNKYIKAPNILELIPASHFFDEMWEKVMILKKAIDYHWTNKRQSPLSVSDQSKILSCFLDQDYSDDNISRTLWPRLRYYFDISDWEKIRLVKGTTSKLINNNSYLYEIVEYVSQYLEKQIQRSVFHIQ